MILIQISIKMGKWTGVAQSLGYVLDDRGSIPGRGNNGIFSPRHRVQTRSGVHPASYPMSTGGLSPGVKRPGREADDSPPLCAEVMNACSYTSITQYVFMRWYLIKQVIRLHGVVLSWAQGLHFTLLSVQRAKAIKIWHNRASREIFPRQQDKRLSLNTSRLAAS